MDDGRDRFLYNYMVFAKKKYADDWAKKVLQAGRNYFEFNQTWTDDYIKKKIKTGRKQQKVILVMINYLHLFVLNQNVLKENLVLSLIKKLIGH